MPEKSGQEVVEKDSKNKKNDSDEANTNNKKPEKRSYYYDDACGYEVFEPGEDEEDYEESNL